MQNYKANEHLFQRTKFLKLLIHKFQFFIKIHELYFFHVSNTLPVIVRSNNKRSGGFANERVHSSSYNFKNKERTKV